MARLQTAIESLNLIGGERQARTWNLRAVEPVVASPQAVAKGNLYVCFELGGEQPASSRLYRLLLNTFQGVYYDAGGGITGGITQAMLAAHEALQQHNLLHPEAEQQGGVSCVVLRGEELYVGIGGPAMVLVGHPGRVEQFPGEIRPSIAPLGGPEAPVIELLRSHVAGEALVVQLQSEWVAQVPTRKLAAAALAPDMEAAQEYLQALAPTTSALSALLVHVTMPGGVEFEDEDEFEDGDEFEFEDEFEDEDEVVGKAVVPGHKHGSPTGKTVGAVAQATEDEEEERASWLAGRWRWLLVLLLPLIAVIVVGAYWAQQRNQRLQIDSLIQGASAALESARAPEAPEATARAQLQDARERLQSALALRAGDAQAEALQAEVQAALDELDRVVPLYKLLTLRQVGGAGSDPSRVIVQGNKVFLLDRGLDTVVRYNLNEISGLIPETASAPVLQRNQAAADGQVVSELVDITWAVAGGNRRSSSLLALDSGRILWEVDDSGILRALPVADKEQWQEPRVVSSYNGNFYLADSGLGRILRYRPSEDGYSNAPENYLEGDASLDLSLIVDMAIDGSIWILYRNGTVQTFLEGRQQPFELQIPPNGPLLQPQAIFVGPDAGDAQSLFIADGLQSRIVQYDKNGDYQRQYRPVDEIDQERMRTLRALQVDEVDRVLYILTAEALYSTNMP